MTEHPIASTVRKTTRNTFVSAVCPVALLSLNLSLSPLPSNHAAHTCLFSTPPPPALFTQSSTLKKACFCSAYAIVLLHEVYHFDLAQQRIFFANTVADFEGSWALGGAAVEFLGASSVAPRK